MPRVTSISAAGRMMSSPHRATGSVRARSRTASPRIPMSCLPPSSACRTRSAPGRLRLCRAACGGRAGRGRTGGALHGSRRPGAHAAVAPSRTARGPLCGCPADDGHRQDPAPRPARCRAVTCRGFADRLTQARGGIGVRPASEWPRSPAVRRLRRNLPRGFNLRTVAIRLTGRFDGGKAGVGTLYAGAGMGNDGCRRVRAGA